MHIRKKYYLYTQIKAMKLNELPTINLLINRISKLQNGSTGISKKTLAKELRSHVRKLKQKVDYRDKVIEKKNTLISEKEARIKELAAEIENLKQAAGKISRPLATSNNSSVPSSQNPIGVKHTQSLRERSNKKAGGQQGHQGVTRTLSDTPDEIEFCQAPIVCPSCGGDMSNIDAEENEIRQVIDLPAEIIPCVTEYIQMKRTCTCGHCAKGEFPKEVIGTVCYGPIIESTVAYLSTLQTIPFKRLSELMENLFGVSMSQGTISNILNRMRKRAQESYEKIRHSVEQSSVVGADETGVTVDGNNHWVWSFQTKLATYLAVNKSRAGTVVSDLFPNGFPESTLVSDRLALYFKVETKDHQVCLAHLLRNTTYISLYIPEIDWGNRMLCLLREAIHYRKENDVSQDKAEYFRNKLDKLLSEDIEVQDDEKQKCLDTFRKGVAKHKEHIFTFLTSSEVPYDNNATERSLRPVKTKTKVSGQFKSIEGAKNYVTLQSIIQTAKKNGKNPLDALLALANYREE